jgi:hypothetical protein
MDPGVAYDIGDEGPGTFEAADAVVADRFVGSTVGFSTDVHVRKKLL